MIAGQTWSYCADSLLRGRSQEHGPCCSGLIGPGRDEDRDDNDDDEDHDEMM